MTQSIQTNIMSLNAQRSLNSTQMSLATAMQRLSSGLRINSAKDDAAGVAIATRMTTQINGLTVAERNANDAISVSQTAEGAMQQMISGLNRAHDLSVQAASYNTNSDRTSLQQEVSQITDELSRIVNQTTYNGQQLLTGGFSGDFQIGADVNQSINVSVSNLDPTSMGVASNYSTVTNLSDSQLAGRIAVSYNNATGGGATLQGASLGAAIAVHTNSATKVAQINAASSQTGISAFSYGNGLTGSAYASAAQTAAAVDGISGGALTINGIAIGAVGAAASNTNVADGLVSAINAVTGQTGVTAVKVNTPDGSTATNDSIVLVNHSGAAITVTANTSVDAGIGTYFANGTTSVAAGANGAIITNGDLSTLSTTYDSSTTGAAITGVSSSTTTLAAASVNAQTVTSAASANLAMLVFQKALDSINSQRSVLGAKLNRMDAVIANIQNVRDNITTARGRIQDADFAQETANLTKSQILQQAGTAMVAQANQSPQLVLQLLK